MRPMAGFTKLHSKIVFSSIWRQPSHVKVVWVTLLAMANQSGVVEGSARGVAHVAGVTFDEFVDAMEVLCGPDPDSSDGTTGERVEVVPGGWFIINHANYRDKQTKEQADTMLRVRRHRERKKAAEDVSGNDVTDSNARSRAPASASGNSASGTSGSVLRPDDVPEQVWDDWLAHRKAKRGKVSKTALDGLRREAKKAGISLADAMSMTVTQNWQGFRAHYVTESRQTRQDRSGRPISVMADLPRVDDEEAIRDYYKGADEIFGQA